MFHMFDTATKTFLGFPKGSAGKESAWNTGDVVQSLGQEDPLERGMATHSSILAWAIPGTEEPGRQAMVHGVSKRVRHDLAIKQQQSPPQPLVASFLLSVSMSLTTLGTSVK